ncbi:MAG: S8 family serine peptidase, partial [Deltaproteobacteria bacterium]|nr:S8 family serine peptidase [Deltaproteobacteria bacterium]
MPLRRLAALSIFVLVAAPPALAEVPYPACQAPACTDPADYASYLFLAPGVLPNDFDPGSGDGWKFSPATGMNVIGAWQRSTGRPDVFVAVLDSGIEWDRRTLAKTTALNTGELPLPPGCAAYDCNGDGVVNVGDYPNVPDANGNGFRDGQDMIRFYADGADDDGNGHVDDIAGWDFYQNDNDPSDDTRYGHGTGEASDQVDEANDGSGFPGVAPSSMFVPLRVADSFIGVDVDFAQAVVYGVDRGAAVISEALGTITASQVSQAAIDYAYRRGVPIIASAADEQSRHHNYPANFEHTLWVNSIRNGDGTFVEQKNDYTIQNGCTNHGGRAWTAISSTSCSSEATGRSGGISLLLVSHGRNLIDRGLLAPYPGNDAAHPFSAEEVRQLFRASADDVDHSANPGLAMNQLLQ